MYIIFIAKILSNILKCRVPSDIKQVTVNDRVERLHYPLTKSCLDERRVVFEEQHAAPLGSDVAAGISGNLTQVFQGIIVRYFKGFINLCTIEFLWVP